MMFKRDLRGAYLSGVLAALSIGCGLLAVCITTPARAALSEVAVIVNPDVPLANLRFSDLRNIALGERQFWKPGLRITLLTRPPGSHEREVALQRLYQMSEAQYRQYWIAKVFRAEVVSGPRTVGSLQTAGELVAEIPGALCFVDAAQIPRGVKVLRIDGRLPGAEGYPLR